MTIFSNFRCFSNISW